jgi:hypothetical protein
MRDAVPAQYELKLEEFTNLLSLVIHDHNVPDALIINSDETNTQFVPCVKNTRCKKGTRRVRIIGVGHEKPQITVTITVAANGGVVGPIQEIYGGKTKGCHPNKGKTPPLEGQCYDHSSSHWQTPSTFLTYIIKVIIPYRLRTIEELGLDPNQKMIFLIDLHYSHKDECVLAMLKENFIIPIYILAGCTDLHQVCDVLVNKPYKNAVARGFVDYVSNQYWEWVNNRDNSDDSIILSLDLASSVMKPRIPEFVACGIRALKTEAMADSIIQCFKTASRLDIAKQESTYERARAALPVSVDILDMPIPTDIEPEEDVGLVELDETKCALGRVHTASGLAGAELNIEGAGVHPATNDDHDNQFDIELQNDSVSDSDSVVDSHHVATKNSASWDSNSDSSSSESPESSNEPLPQTKRIRRQNTMVGSVAPGKYSANQK